jgi:phage portal protein, HK97 family
MAFRWPWQSRSLENPATSLSDPDYWPSLGAVASNAGVSVTPESSLGVTAVWAAVRRISSSIASLPLHTYQRTTDGKQKATGHPLYSLLHDRWNPELSSFAARELMMAHLLLFGDSFHEIERNGAGLPIALWPIHPLNVAVERVAGQKRYRVDVGGSPVILPAESVLHVQGFSLGDGLRGLFPVSVARNAIGSALATDSYAAKWFNGGGQPAGVLSHPAKLGPVATKNIADSWKQRALTDAQRIEVLEEGMKYTPISLSPEQSQALESRRYSVSEVARLFLIPPHLLADLDRATFSNVEQQSIEYVQHCLMPWCRRIESEMTYRLLDDGHFAEFSLDGLLRGDSQSRAEYLSAMLDRGVFSINEARAYENMPPIPQGDVHRVALNTAPLGEDGSNEQ